MDRFLPYVAMALCAVAIFADFASKILSITVDGIILSLVIAILYKMKNKP